MSPQWPITTRERSTPSRREDVLLREPGLVGGRGVGGDRDARCARWARAVTSSSFRLRSVTPGRSVAHLMMPARTPVPWMPSLDVAHAGSAASVSWSHASIHGSSVPVEAGRARRSATPERSATSRITWTSRPRLMGVRSTIVRTPRSARLASSAAASVDDARHVEIVGEALPHRPVRDQHVLVHQREAELRGVDRTEHALDRRHRDLLRAVLGTAGGAAGAARDPPAACLAGPSRWC